MGSRINLALIFRLCDIWGEGMYTYFTVIKGEKCEFQKKKKIKTCMAECMSSDGEGAKKGN